MEGERGRERETDRQTKNSTNHCQVEEAQETLRELQGTTLRTSTLPLLAEDPLATHTPSHTGKP